MSNRASERQQLATLQQHMPIVLGMVRERAAVMGNEVYALVRRGMRGEPGCFWAMERGHVVGTPFSGQAIEADVAALMVQFGCQHVCILGLCAERPDRACQPGAEVHS